MNGARKVAVINQTFAHKYLGSDNPIGQRVGVAQLETIFRSREGCDGSKSSAWSPTQKTADCRIPSNPKLWVPYTVTGSNERGILVRTAKRSSLDVERRAPGNLGDGSQRRADVSTARSRATSASFPTLGRDFGFFLLGIFATIGLALVTIGVYSVLAYTAARRTHEIGIRMALGAERGDVLKLVINMGLRLVILGVAIGLAASSGVGRVVATQLWGVSPYDPATLVAVPLVLLITGLVACWVPARRAARVDPLVALRYE